MKDIKLVIHEAVREAWEHQLEFSLDEFKRQPPERRVGYLRLHAKYVAEGSSRMVFDVGGGKVLKILKVDNTEQNAKEIRASQCAGNSSVITKVLEASPDGEWLIAEKADRLFDYGDEKELFQLQSKALGLPPELQLSDDFAITTILGLAKRRMGGMNDLSTLEKRFGKDSVEYQRMIHVFEHPTKWLVELVNLLKNCSISPVDLAYDNWGMKNGILVLVDYGV